MRRLLLATALIAAPACAQEAGDLPLPQMSPSDFAIATPDSPRPQQPPGRTLPLVPARRFQADVTHGTWMSLDLAPDGAHIVFDVLGDLYTIPAAGGAATRISGGVPLDTQPTYSPDGRWIAYISDRSGADNLWIARPDGSAARQISFGDDDTVLVSPAWSADGKAVFLSRYRPDLNNYELWRYDIGGPQTLIVPVRDTPTSPRDSWRSTLGAVASPDGRYVYVAQHVGGLDFDEVDNWTIVRRDLSTGAQTTIVAEPAGPRTALNPGAFFRPALSPDGRLLAYGTRIEGQTELRLRDLATGADKRLAYPVEHDQVQASMWQDLLPRYAFARDGRTILLSVRGSIERIALDDGAVTPIPFSAHLDIPIGASTRQDIRDASGPVQARLIMAPVASPDGRAMAFSALGQLFTMALDGHAAPVRFATGSEPAFEPSWSADGTQITWVTWSEHGAGAVWRAPVDGSSPPMQLSNLPAYYSYPVFAPDGQSIVVVRSAQQARLHLYMEYGKLRDAELVSLPIAGGAGRVLTSGRIGGRPQFAAGKLYILADDGLDVIDPVSGQRTLAAQVKGPGWYFQDGAVPVDDIRISPDGRWLLAQVAQQLHIVAMPAAGGTVDLANPQAPHRRISAAGADYFEWSADGRMIAWSTGSTLHTRPLAGVTLSDKPDWSAESAPAGQRDYRADITIPRAVATGTLLLRGARVLTMAGSGSGSGSGAGSGPAADRVIDNADILVEDGRFAAVGPRGSLSVPPGTAIRDVTGKTIVPGFIDTHDHIATVRRDVLGLQDWGLQARLAWGVTTSFDPSTLTIDMLAYQDMLDAGPMIGPRLRQTGVALFSMQRFGSLDDVLTVMHRYRDDYRIHNIKEYRTGDRRVRQWVVEACRILGMQPTTEGALAMKLDLTQILDGYAGNEHALVASPLQEDVLKLLAFTRTSYTTTLEITNGGPPGQDWSIDRDDPHAELKLDHFWPRFAIDQMMLRRPWRTLAEYRFPAIAADAAAVQRGGGLVGIGSHGETPGIGFHYEMEAHAQGGMTPMAILHAATIGSAETIGRMADLGSIEPGKIADLVILDQDPRTDIRNARAVAQVMRDGRLYDAATLGEIWPRPTSAQPSWFADSTDTAHWLPAGDSP